MMTEKVGLVALCFGWVALGAVLVPRLEPSDAELPALTWILVAACPVAFLLASLAAGRFTRRPVVVPAALSVLALGIEVGRRLGLWQVHPNDFASLLALLVPWWAVLAIRSKVSEPGTKLGGSSRALGWIAPTIRTVLCTVFCAVAAAGLFSTGSRGGVLAACAGLLAGLLLTSLRRRRLVLILLLCAVLATAIVPSLSDTDAFDDARAWIRDHDAEGFTWRHLSSGRLNIWRQSVRVVEDFPLFGVGPGAYGALVPDVYAPPIRRIDLHHPDAPRTPRVDDAHSLYLESAVAFGLPFLTAFLLLCGLSLARLALRAPSAAHGAAFAGLLAYLLHGLVDCAAPGTVVYLAGWAALGTAWAPAESVRDVGRPRSARRGAIAWAGALGLLVVFAAVVLQLPTERLHHRAVRSLDDPAPMQRELSERAQHEPCRDAWWRERLALAAGTSHGVSDATAIARCSPHRIPDLAALFPRDADRATAVFAERPRDAEALRWRLWTLTPTHASPDPLVAGYFRYFALRPDDADAKMEFLRRQDRTWLDRHPHTVLALLAHACAHGDPGANACLGAGTLARRLELGAAVADAYFLSSEWPGARSQASEFRRD